MAQVPPESFCELWIRDTKYVQQPCVALTVYVAMCHKFHVCIEWRRSDYCRELWGRGAPPLLLWLSPLTLVRVGERLTDPSPNLSFPRFNFSSDHLLILINKLINILGVPILAQWK